MTEQETTRPFSEPAERAETWVAVEALWHVVPHFASVLSEFDDHTIRQLIVTLRALPSDQFLRVRKEVAEQRSHYETKAYDAGWDAGLSQGTKERDDLRERVTELTKMYRFERAVNRAAKRARKTRKAKKR